MNHPDEVDVLIVGAGVGGLGLACALARFDVRVLLVERRRGPGGIHRGDSLLPKSTRSLLAWGLGDALRTAGAVPLDAFEVHAGGRALFRGPLVPPGTADPYLVLPHAEIERVLEQRAVAAGRASVLRQARFVGFMRDAADRVIGAHVETKDGLREVRARVVVGADGQRSVVRDRLGLTLPLRGYDHAYLGLEADRPAGYEDALRLNLHEDGGVLITPRLARDDQQARVGLGVLVEKGGGPRWLGLDDDALRAELARRAPVLEGATLHRRGAHVYELAHGHAPAYHHDGAVLLGDAIHATNPTAGQGMTSALLDADALARALGPALERGVRDLRLALHAYQAERRPDNERLVRQAHRLARVYAWRGLGLGHATRCALARALGTRAGAAAGRAVARAFMSTTPPSAATPVASNGADASDGARPAVVLPATVPVTVPPDGRPTAGARPSAASAPGSTAAPLTLTRSAA